MFEVRHDCPQCGAESTLNESDRVLTCAYCGVRNVLWSARLFRFVLVPQVKVAVMPANDELVYAPYLRFRGSALSLRGAAVCERVLDLSRVALASRVLPPGLGFRGQTQLLRFVEAHTRGTFLRASASAAAILNEALASEEMGAPVLSGESPEEQARSNWTAGPRDGAAAPCEFIGEAMSFIYHPFLRQGRLLADGITGDPVARIPDGFDFSSLADPGEPRSDLRAQAAVCPHCGFNLEGEPDSVALSCGNCGTVWEAVAGSWQRREVETIPSRREATIHLPFWRLWVQIRGLSSRHAESLGVAAPANEDAGPENPVRLEVWGPAFKIRPRLMLMLACRLSGTPVTLRGEAEVPRGRRHPITLPASEAAQVVRFTLAEMTMRKTEVVPGLAAANVTLENAAIAYVPFAAMGAELVQSELGLSVSSAALGFGRRL
jgi:DNA-directed RNA polymerase subunit RPC12/RpoP